MSPEELALGLRKWGHQNLNQVHLANLKDFSGVDPKMILAESEVVQSGKV